MSDSGIDVPNESRSFRRSLHVFLCHASNDKPKVRELYRQLVAKDIAVWFDEEDLLPGQDWQLEIPKAVRTSDVVIVCLSQTAVTKTGYIQKEIRYALDVADEQPEGVIFLIPLKLEECEVPERLQRWQWVNLFEEKGFERLMRALQERSEKSERDKNRIDLADQPYAPVRRKKIAVPRSEKSAETTLPDASQIILARHNRPHLPGPVLPPIGLLNLEEAEFGINERELVRQTHQIEQALKDFGIPAKVIRINEGPTIRQFELELGFVVQRGPHGQANQRKVSVTKIFNIKSELELALGATPIRIEAPVPGRSTVGIEIPNKASSVVSMRNLMETAAFQQEKSPLKISLGIDVYGNPTIVDLETMQHLLITGASRSGKSACVCAIIACLLFRNSPDDLRFIMVDPKRVELTIFNEIPHLLGPIVYNGNEVVAVLHWIMRETDNRFAAFAKEKVRDIHTYNQKAIKDSSFIMPFIVTVIDDFDILSIASADRVEETLMRLIQRAHIAGIHLVLATQRPSDNLSRLLKAGFFTRVVLRMASTTDSRAVLEAPDAESLIGYGDTLLKTPGSMQLIRTQACFVSDDELIKLVQFWHEKAAVDTDSIPPEAPWKNSVDVREETDKVLIDQAKELLKDYDHVSISFIQRKLGIGYSRAARLIDQLEKRGIVGPDGGSGKGRTVTRK